MAKKYFNVYDFKHEEAFIGKFSMKELREFLNDYPLEEDEINAFLYEVNMLKDHYRTATVYIRPDWTINATWASSEDDEDNPIRNMSFEELNDALCNKIRAAFEEYKASLENMSVSEALTHSYEYVIRENIMEAIANISLSQGLEREELEALLQADDPLGDIYDYWMDTNVDCMQEIIDTIKDRANAYMQTEGDF